MSWRSRTIDNIKANVPYGCVGGPFGSELTTRDYVDSGIPVIRGNNLSSDRKFLDGDFVFVSEQKANSLSSNLAFPNDLIFTQRGTLGQVGIIPREANYERYVISQSQMKLTVEQKIVRPEFVYYYFRQPRIVETIRRRAISSGVPHINLGILKSMSIGIPSLDEQSKIVDVLSSYDDLIEKNRRRIQLLEQAARLLYKEWFVRLRFPGHEHVKIKDGVPEGWGTKPIFQVADINRLSLGNDYDGEIDYIDISSVTTGCINETTRYRFRDAPSRARRIVQHGDIIWSCVRPNRRSHAVIWKPPQTFIASTGFAVITPMTLPTSFLYHALTTEEFVGYLTNNARGAAYPAVTASDFEKWVILVPKAHLVEQFDDVVSSMLAQIHVLTQESSRLCQARDLLLPRLMNGEIAV